MNPTVTQIFEAIDRFGLVTVLTSGIFIFLTWVYRDERTNGRTNANMSAANDRLMKMNEELADELKEMRAEIRTLHAQLADSETARINDRMELETRLEHIKDDLAQANERAETMEGQNEAMKAQLDEALKRLAQAECQRDEIAAKSHAEKQQFETTIQRLSAEVEQLRELVARLQAPGVEAPGLTD